MQEGEDIKRLSDEEGDRHVPYRTVPYLVVLLHYRTVPYHLTILHGGTVLYHTVTLPYRTVANRFCHHELGEKHFFRMSYTYRTVFDVYRALEMTNNNNMKL
jgi:hypothetical protein